MNEKSLSKNRFISIGKLSKVTGVHIQSLRYYERIGILLPAYIDIDSKYRYYSFSQIKIVEAIQYCVELDIPLKDFSLFISCDQNQIDYERLLHYGKKLAQQKIQAIKNKMYFFEKLNEDMIHGEICSGNEFIISRLPKKTYLTVPYNGTQANNVFQSVVLGLLEQIRANGWQTSYDSGLLSRYSEHKTEHFAFVDILNVNEQILQNSNVIQIPEMDFICMKKKTSNIQTAPEIYREQFEKTYEKIVIERELFKGKFQYKMPVYEIRCSLEN